MIFYKGILQEILKNISPCFVRNIFLCQEGEISMVGALGLYKVMGESCKDLKLEERLFKISVSYDYNMLRLEIMNRYYIMDKVFLNLICH